MCKKQIESWSYFDLVVAIGSACLLGLLLDKWVLPIVFIIECRVFINVQRHSPISYLNQPLFHHKIMN